MSDAITSDNIHLSRLIQPYFEVGSAAVSNPLSPLSCSDPKILEFIAAATSANTRRAYQSDLAHFLAWGGSIPAAAEQVARYLADHAASLSINEIGAAIILCRSKTDQTGHGRTVSIPRMGGRLCPVAALEEWVRFSGIAGGPLFRPVAKSGRAAERRMSAEAVARIVKKRTWAVGCDPDRYSGHSLRAGFATEAARCGVPKWRIKAQTGHLSDSILERYIREPAVCDFAGLRSVFASGQPQSDLHEIEAQRVAQS